MQVFDKVEPANSYNLDYSLIDYKEKGKDYLLLRFVSPPELNLRNPKVSVKLYNMDKILIEKVWELVEPS